MNLSVSQECASLRGVAYARRTESGFFPRANAFDDAPAAVQSVEVKEEPGPPSFPPPPPLVPEDFRLAQRCVAGERAAQEKVFYQYRRLVRAALCRILGANTFIDDLVQDAFIGIFRSLRTFRGDCALSTWIDRCAARIAYAHAARMKGQPRAVELMVDLPSEEASSERRALAREAARHLYAELDKMEAKQRVAFTLHAIEGHSLNEVAELMKASLVATKTRVWRARRAVEKRALRDPVLAAFVTRKESDGGSDGDSADDALAA